MVFDALHGLFSCEGLEDDGEFVESLILFHGKLWVFGIPLLSQGLWPAEADLCSCLVLLLSGSGAKTLGSSPGPGASLFIHYEPYI